MVTAYVKFCQDLCFAEKEVKCYNNSKPWFNSDIKVKMKQQEESFREKDTSKMKIAKYNVRKAIKTAKKEYSAKLDDKFATNDTRSVWQGLQAVTNYKQKKPTLPDNTNKDFTPDKLNHYYGRFDRQNNTTPPLPDPASPLPPPFKIETHEVNTLFRKQNTNKAPGPDGILTTTLRHCADQLSPVFTDIFNESLCTQVIPSCFKVSHIVPVPKKPTVMSLNDFRPVALTSVVMKVFERLVLKYMKSVTDQVLDP